MRKTALIRAVRLDCGREPHAADATAPNSGPILVEKPPLRAGMLPPHVPANSDEIASGLPDELSQGRK